MHPGSRGTRLSTGPKPHSVSRAGCVCIRVVRVGYTMGRCVPDPLPHCWVRCPTHANAGQGNDSAGVSGCLSTLYDRDKHGGILSFGNLMAPQHTVARVHRLYIARPPAGFLNFNGTEINGVALPGARPRYCVSNYRYMSSSPSMLVGFVRSRLLPNSSKHRTHSWYRTVAMKRGVRSACRWHAALPTVSHADQ